VPANLDGGRRVVEGFGLIGAPAEDHGARAHAMCQWLDAPCSSRCPERRDPNRSLVGVYTARGRGHGHGRYRAKSQDGSSSQAHRLGQLRDGNTPCSAMM
jgi:hypothetical protein